MVDEMKKVKANNSVRQYLADIGKKGGEAQVSKGIGKLTEQQRKAISAKGVAARKQNAKKAAKKK